MSESLARAVTLANGLAGEASTEATWVQISGEPLSATARVAPEGAGGSIEPSPLGRAAGAFFMTTMALASGYAALQAARENLMAAVLFGAFAWGAIKSAELKTCQACRRTFTVAASAGPQCSECLRTAEERHKACEWAERERQRIAKEEARRLAAVAEEKKREAKRAAEQMRLDARLKEQDAWLELSPVEFEQGVARLFEREGFIVFVTAQSGDGGIDIELRKDDERRIVQ